MIYCEASVQRVDLWSDFCSVTADWFGHLKAPLMDKPLRAPSFRGSRPWNGTQLQMCWRAEWAEPGTCGRDAQCTSQSLIPSPRVDHREFLQEVLTSRQAWPPSAGSHSACGHKDKKIRDATVGERLVGLYCHAKAKDLHHFGQELLFVIFGTIKTCSIT